MERTVKQRIIDFIKYKGITVKSFEERCELSNGYISSMRKGFGREKLENVLTEFPELNREWLLYGEGDMLVSGNQIVSGSNNTTSQNSGNTTNNTSNNFGDGRGGAIYAGRGGVSVDGALMRAFDEIAAQRGLAEEAHRQTSKAQEQIDRLLSIIEKLK